MAAALPATKCARADEAGAAAPAPLPATASNVPPLLISRVPPRYDGAARGGGELSSPGSPSLLSEDEPEEFGRMIGVHDHDRRQARAAAGGDHLAQQFVAAAAVLHVVAKCQRQLLRNGKMNRFVEFS